MKHLTLTTVILLALSGCGGGSSNTPAATQQNTGFVGDGYIEGAYVCHDSDQDMDCLDETYATTLADGSFVLPNYDNTKEVLVHIPVGAVDNGPFANGSTTPRPFTAQTWYYYPVGVSATGPIFIGTLSTLVAAIQDAVPGLSTNDAINIIANNLEITPEQVTGNYLEDNTEEGNNTQFIAEIVGTSIANTTNDTSSYSNDIQTVLSDLGNVTATASNSNSSTYDTATYVTPTPTGVTPLLYTPVADVCNDLLSGTYFAFESWNTGDREHKTLYMTSDNKLNIRVEVENNNGWSVDQENSSAEALYLSRVQGTRIDMTQVNSSNTHTAPAHDLPLPAVNTACNGSSATFDIGAGVIYTLYVAEADISGISGASLPQGPSVNSILNPVTFGAGDKIYKTTVVTQTDGYGVDNGQNSNPNDYTVYEEGTMGGTAFSTMLNSNNINSMVQLTDTDFIVEYENNNNYVQLELTSTVASNNTGTVDVIKVENGAISSTISMTYEVETHNATPFFIVKNYDGFGYDLFIGKIDAIDASSLVYGIASRAGGMHYLTEGGFQDGDVMDDIMLNSSARDRVLTQLNTQSGVSIPTPILP